MKIKKIESSNIPTNYGMAAQILGNRGMDIENILALVNANDSCINDPSLLEYNNNLSNACKILCQTVCSHEEAVIIVDSDCDGFTSAAILINYLYDLFPAWAQNKLSWFHHNGKEHGLNDYVFKNESLIIVPDAGSNDYEKHAEAVKLGKNIIVIDHHEADKISENAIVINNQLCNYPNKSFSGAGVIWQFCRYLDKLTGFDFADKYLDLCALGNIADVMDMRSVETNYLARKGITQIRNPWFLAMKQKNAYSLGIQSDESKLTTFGVAFYVAPYLNAIVRSGTQKERELVFNSMIEFKAKTQIPSTKRGHKPNDMETILEQAIRTVDKVKRRQTDAVNAGMELAQKVVEEHCINAPVLVLGFEEGMIDKNIAGLVATKIANKYMRPCTILIRSVDTVQAVTNDDTVLVKSEKIYWRGSARGFTRTGCQDFRQECLNTGVVEYAQGHANAFGLSIADERLKDFCNAIGKQLSYIDTEVCYLVDEVFNSGVNNPQDIIDIANMDYLWGAGIEESKVAITNLKVRPNQVFLYDKGRNPAVKIQTETVDIMKFGKDAKEFADQFESVQGYLLLDIVGTCHINEWMGRTRAQIFMEDFTIVDSVKYDF